MEKVAEDDRKTLSAVSETAAEVLRLQECEEARIQKVNDRKHESVDVPIKTRGRDIFGHPPSYSS